jgi:hypothetical protein
MGLSDDRPFTPKSDRTSSPLLFYILLRSPALKVFEVRSRLKNKKKGDLLLVLSFLLKKQIETADRINQHFQYTSSWLPISSKRISSSPDSGFSTKLNTIRQSYSTEQAQEPAN